MKSPIITKTILKTYKIHSNLILTGYDVDAAAVDGAVVEDDDLQQNHRQTFLCFCHQTSSGSVHADGTLAAAFVDAGIGGHESAAAGASAVAVVDDAVDGRWKPSSHAQALQQFLVEHGDGLQV